MKKTDTSVATKPFLTRAEIQERVRVIREELENRVKTGMSKIAFEDGKPVPTESLQNEMFSLIYRLSKFD
jgi:hypothetical protein